MKMTKMTMKEKIKKTSEEWMEITGKFEKIIILDPDGWDRTNFQFSFYEEKITHGEFISRIMESTIQGKIDKEL